MLQPGLVNRSNYSPVHTLDYRSDNSSVNLADNVLEVRSIDQIFVWSKL